MHAIRQLLVGLSDLLSPSIRNSLTIIRQLSPLLSHLPRLETLFGTNIAFCLVDEFLPVCWAKSCSTQRRLSGGVSREQFHVLHAHDVLIHVSQLFDFASVRRLQRYPIGLSVVSASLHQAGVFLYFLI